MLKVFQPNKFQNRQTITIDDAIEKQSSKIINLVGYVILLLALLDAIASFIPAKFFDPNWELTTIGKNIEAVWAPLLGFVLIFYRRQQEPIKFRELKILSFISSLSLILGIIYLLTVPLLITDTFRISRSNHAQVNLQLEAQRIKVKQITEQLNQANESQLNIFLTKYRQQAPDLQDYSIQELKNNFLSRINKEQQAKNGKSNRDLASRQQALSKIAIKWILGALISGISCIFIWRETSWSRAIVAYKKQEQKI